MFYFLIELFLTASIIVIIFGCSAARSNESLHDRYIISTNTSNGTQILKAVVLSNNHTRFASTEKCLVEAGFHDIEIFQAINIRSNIIDEYCRNLTNDPKRFKDEKLRKIVSNRISFLNILTSFRDEPSNISSENDWRFIFEDDIASFKVHVRNYPILIYHGMELAKKDGIMSLGTCGADQLGESDFYNSIEYRKIVGPCAHAFGLAKWRTRSFIDEIEKYENKIKTFDVFDHIVQNIFLNKSDGILLVGVNLHSPYDWHHRGLFWQDRITFKSDIGRI